MISDIDLCMCMSVYNNNNNNKLEMRMFIEFMFRNNIYFNKILIIIFCQSFFVSFIIPILTGYNYTIYRYSDSFHSWK